MEKINLCEGFMAQMMEADAWSNLSSDFQFSEAQLEKYEDKLDWKEISRNRNIFWTIPMLEKFIKRLDWQELSRFINDEVLSVELLDKFKDYWNWEVLSESATFTPEIVEHFADNIYWKGLINNRDREHIRMWTEDFVRKYSDRIPAGEFKDSFLWKSLIEAKVVEFKRRIIIG